MNIKQILKEEIESVGLPIIQRSFFETVDIEKGDFREALSESTNIVKAYHGSRNPGEKAPHDGMFFSLDSWYAKALGGQYLHTANLTVNNPLYLDKYNKILIKNGITGSYAQPPLTVSSFNIKEKWSWYLDAIWNKGLQNVAEEFEKEIHTCDSIYGQDAGNKDTRVWYIKHANQVQFIDL